MIRGARWRQGRLSRVDVTHHHLAITSIGGLVQTEHGAELVTTAAPHGLPRGMLTLDPQERHRRPKRWRLHTVGYGRRAV